MPLSQHPAYRRAVMYDYIVTYRGASRDQVPTDINRFEQLCLALLNLTDSDKISVNYNTADPDTKEDDAYVVVASDRESHMDIESIVANLGLKAIRVPMTIGSAETTAGCGTLIVALFLAVSAAAALASVLR